MRRGLLIAGGVVAVLGTAAALAYEPVLRHVVRSEAEKGGVELSRIEDVSYGFDSVTLEGVDLSLAGVDGLEARAETLELSLDGLEPTAITARGLEVELTGSAVDLLLALGVWTEAHPKLWRLPADVEDVDLSWRALSGAEPWLSAEGGRIEPTDRGARLEARSARIVGVGVGRVGATWDGSGARASFGFGEDDLDEAPLTAVVHHEEVPARLEIHMAPTPLIDLAGPLAMLLPVKGVRIGGDAALSLLSEGRIEGTVSAKVHGFRPPVPPELHGFVFGDTTAIHSEVGIDEAFDTVELTGLEVAHGGITLRGGGTIDREGDDAVVELTLKGSIGCAALAAAAARSRVGGEVGHMVGGLAGHALDGSVGFTAEIHADTDNLLDAKVDSRIGVGCGLKPLSPEDLPDMSDGGPNDLPKLPKIPGLPPLPQ